MNDSFSDTLQYEEQTDQILRQDLIVARSVLQKQSNIALNLQYR
jgi:hypothetical protein